MPKKKPVKRKAKKKEPDYVSLPALDLSDHAKRSITIVVLLVLAVVSFLGLFNMAGHFGLFLSDNLSLGFGFGQWLVPILFLYWALILIRKSKRPLKFSDYLGLFLFFASYQTLFHFFYKQENWETIVKLGKGGGYVGLYLSQAVLYVFGFWGGVVVLLALLFISGVLVFNTSLSKIIGRESLFARGLQPFTTFFKTLFSSSEREDEEEGEVEEEDHQEALEGWQEKEVEGDTEEEEEEKPNVAKTKKDKKKKQEQIVWPKRQVKIDMPLELLSDKKGKAIGGDVEENAIKIQKTLENFGIDVEMAETKVGPTVTQYTFKPAEGVKLSRITTLNNDLSLALAAHPIRIEAPIPGQSLVGIEVPNKAKAIVGLKDVLESDPFKIRKNNLMIALGKDVAGTSWLYDISRMPHLLVAGATNSGKSVCLNAIIISLLYQNNPEDLRFIMVDPKRVELPTYNGIPHLLTPVITEVAKTINALKWCLNEMDRRYDVLNKAGKKNIQSYNNATKERLPYIVFIIDELADFMMTSGKEMEAAIVRLAQMSRAVGIHLILATQRPSVDVITGLIKANIPARIAFSVASLVDSKTILDMSGAEKLLGQGDMLFVTAELSKPKRIQGAYLSDNEINDVVNYIKEKSGPAEYLEGITDRQKVSGNAGVGLDGTHGDEDELFDEAKEIIVKAGKASTSMLQRRLSIGYGRAAKILDMLEDSGIIGPPNGSKPREVMISQDQMNALDDQGISGVSLHNRDDAEAPGSYFGDEGEGDDGVLVLDRDKDEEESEEEEGSEEEVEEEIETEEENDEEAEEEDDNEPEEVKEVEKKPNEKTPFEDDDEMFFAK